MKTVQLQTWELHYSESAAALLLLVNGNTIFFLTHENILDFLEAVSDTVAPVVCLAQPMVTQQLNFEVEVNEDDGTEEEYAVYNWKLDDRDLSRFEIGDKEMMTLEFAEPRERQMFLSELFSNDTVEWLTLDY
jgi:hypothetical protein